MNSYKIQYFSHFPEEIIEEIIMWCDRIQLGERVSLVRQRYFRISFPFMHEEKVHPLPKLEINGGNHKPWMFICYADESYKKLSKSEVPSVEIPENIIADKNQLIIR